MHLWYNVVNLINVYSITEFINTLYPVDILINYHCSSLFIVIAHHLSLFIVEPFLSCTDCNCESFQGSYRGPK